MKRKNFLTLFIITIVMMFISVSCTDPIPDCEKNNTCKVKIVNNTNYFLFVDVTYSDDMDNFNDERQLGFDMSTVYLMHPGHMIVWAANSVNRENNDWDYSDIYVDQCEDYKFTWTSSKKGTATLTISDGDSRDYDEAKAQQKNNNNK